MTINICRACNKPLLNRRPQTKTCNAACRAKHWRQSRVSMLPVQLMLSLANHSFFTKAADAAGVSINDHLHDRLIKSMECSSESAT